MSGRTPRILYIMGTGRSGSTILDVLLSNNPGMAGCGELNYIFREGFSQNNECSCGKACRDCDFWGNVMRQGGFDPKDCMELFELFMRIEWHSGFFPTFLGLRSRAKMRRYRETNERLLAAIEQVSGAGTIVDSSKYPGRALCLHRLLGSGAKILFLTRSPKGLIRSFQKKSIEQTSKSPFKVLLYNSYVMLTGQLVRLAAGKDVLMVRFEDLCADPAGTLERVEAWSGLDFSQSKERLRREESFQVGHIVRGNRLRKEREVHFRAGAKAESGSPGLVPRLCAAAMAVINRILLVR